MGLGYNWVYHILLISIFKVCDLLIGKRSDTLVMLWVIFFWERHLGNRVPSMRLLNAMPISVIPYLPLVSGSIGLFSQQAFTLDQESKDILKECSTLVVTICQVLNFKCSPPPRLLDFVSPQKHHQQFHTGPCTWMWIPLSGFWPSWDIYLSIYICIQ